MIRIVVVAAIACALGAVGVDEPSAAVSACGSYSVGPGALVRGNSGGARCMLTAYRTGCSKARYKLSIFGVDTVGTRDFSVVRLAGRCQVAVSTTFRVVPQPAHPGGHGFCRTLRVAGKAIVATGCKGSGLPSSISLTA